MENPNCKIDKYGYAKNEDTDCFVIGLLQTSVLM